MMNASQVEAFANRLKVPVETVEQEWRDWWSRRMVNTMRSLAPVDTGALRDSIQTGPGGVVVGVDYGVYVEYGTATNAPRPFAVPAIEINRQPATDALRRRILRQLT